MDIDGMSGTDALSGDGRTGGEVEFALDADGAPCTKTRFVDNVVWSVGRHVSSSASCSSCPEKRRGKATVYLTTPRT